MEESLTQNLTESIKNVLGLKEISPAQLSPLVLAYIGDSIFDLVIKTYLLDTKGNMQVNKLNRFASNKGTVTVRNDRDYRAAVKPGGRSGIQKRS